MNENIFILWKELCLKLHRNQSATNNANIFGTICNDVLKKIYMEVESVG